MCSAWPDIPQSIPRRAQRRTPYDGLSGGSAAALRARPVDARRSYPLAARPRRDAPVAGLEHLRADKQRYACHEDQPKDSPGKETSHRTPISMRPMYRIRTGYIMNNAEDREQFLLANGGGGEKADERYSSAAWESNRSRRTRRSSASCSGPMNARAGMLRTHPARTRAAARTEPRAGPSCRGAGHRRRECARRCARRRRSGKPGPSHRRAAR